MSGAALERAAPPARPGQTFGKISFEKGEYRIETTPYVAMRLKRWFPRISIHARGVISLKDAPDVARDLEWLMLRFPLERAPAANDQLQKGAAAHVERELFTRGLLDGSRQPRHFELKLPPRSYQSLAAELVLKNGGLLCADDLGIGKTATAICVAIQPDARPFLVVTLTHLPGQYQREFAKFSDMKTVILEGITPYDVRYGKPKNSKRVTAIEGQQSLHVPPYPDVIITSYSKLAGWAEYLAGLVKGVNWDEAQELRHGDSQKYAGAQLIASMAKYRIATTATPIHNYGDEMWEVLQCVAPDMLGTKQEFLTEWCGSTNQRGQAEIKDTKAFGTYLRDQGVLLRRTRNDVGIELPPLTRIIHEIDEGDEDLGLDKDAARELATRLLREEKRLGLDAMQDARDFDIMMRQATGVAKAPYVAEFVKMLLASEEKVAVAAWHRRVYDILLEKLKDFEIVMYTGTETPAEKEKSVHAFVHGSARVMLMSLASGAGLNDLQLACSTCVHAELAWTPALHGQFDGRFDRPGQTRPVMSYFMLSQNGSDPVIADLLALKRAQMVGIRDPDAEVFEKKAQNEEGRIKLLAQHYLESLK
jgi:SNF2 family DNA or RNA helicase